MECRWQTEWTDQAIRLSSNFSDDAKRAVAYDVERLIQLEKGGHDRVSRSVGELDGMEIQRGRTCHACRVFRSRDRDISSVTSK